MVGRVVFDAGQARCGGPPVVDVGHEHSYIHELPDPDIAMVQVRLDSETCRQLGAVGQSVELCDDDGRVIGVFLPEGCPHGLPPAGLAIPLSVEEIQRRRQSRSGRTLEEILRGLEPR